MVRIETGLIRCLATVVTVVIVLSGCTEDRGEVTVIDLVDAFSSARVSFEVNRIDFADPKIKHLLGSGWVLPNQTDEPRTWSWAVGERSTMTFFRLTPEDLVLKFKCMPYDFEHGRNQKVAFIVNERPVSEVDLVSGPQEISVEVPAEVLRAGENHLTMEYAESRTRSEPYSKRSDDRAVAWSVLRIKPKSVSTASTPSVDTQARRLFIPLGARVDFVIDGVAAGEFTAAGLNTVGAKQARLIVSSQVGRLSESVVDELKGDRGRFDLRISGDDRKSIRLSLAVVGSPKSCKGSCGIVLFEPVVTSISERTTAMPDGGTTPVDKPPPARPPNVVIYLIDALRADHLGCYGYRLPTSPSIDEFAATAVLFERAQAQTSWTRASVASIFSGLVAQVHQANDDDDALSPDVVTIAEYLEEAGYRTAGFTSNGNAGPKVGFGQGFEVFRNFGRHGEPVRSEELNRAAEAWLDTVDRDRPFLLWIHAVDPHTPYMPPDDLRAVFAPGVTDHELGSNSRVEELTRTPALVTDQIITDMVSLYDAEIAANDRVFGALIDGLKTRGLDENTLVILVSDHGEEFYDHGGWTHGKTLFAEQLDIPLIIRFPERTEGSRVSQIVQHVDLLPTILVAAGVPEPTGVQGLSLQRLLTEEGRHAWVDRAYASLDLRGRRGTSVMDGRWKVIRFHDRGVGHLPMLYDKHADREERSDLVAVAPDRAATLLALDRRFGATLPTPYVAPVVDMKAKRAMWDQLKALGYVQ